MLRTIASDATAGTAQALYTCEPDHSLVRVALYVCVRAGGLVTSRLSSAVTKSALAPFDCVTNAQGVRTMDAEPSIVCDAPGGGPHRRMKVVASIVVALFVVGVPALMAVVLYRNRRAIIDDQKLRQKGEGDTRLTNDNITTRHRYRKLYEDYQPQRLYWKVVLLARKLAFALIVVLLSSNITAQVRPARQLRNWRSTICTLCPSR